jgi:hypothetical protein
MNTNGPEYRKEQNRREQNTIEYNTPGLLGTRDLLNEMAKTNNPIILLGIETGRTVDT